MNEIALTDAQRFENERRLHTTCLLHGITAITVTFNGSGDSGQIDDIFFDGPEDSIKLDKKPITVFVQSGSEFDQVLKQWVSRPVQEKLVQLGEFVSNHVYDALARSHVDWVNNDGGFGTWEWSPQEGVKFKVYWREVKKILGHSETRRLGHPEGEDDEEAA